MYYLKRNKPLKAKSDKPKRKTPKTDYVRKLDDVFSLYIRLRDSKPYGFKAFRCISCGKIKPFEQADCGHYFSRRHMATRFDEENCHCECRACNRFSADHLDGYLRNLTKKIGEQRVELLRWKHTQTKHWTDFELKELIKYYKARIEMLKKGL